MSENVTKKSDPDRYEIAVEEGVAGFTQFVDVDGQRVFFHTEIGDDFGGRGLAGTLVREALDATRTNGLRVVPVCPYVKSFVGKHHEYDDIVDPVTPAALAAVPRS